MVLLLECVLMLSWVICAVGACGFCVFMLFSDEDEKKA
jgi:hypothetical protein